MDSDAIGCAVGFALVWVLALVFGFGFLVFGFGFWFWWHCECGGGWVVCMDRIHRPDVRLSSSIALSASGVHTTSGWNQYTIYDTITRYTITRLTSPPLKTAWSTR